MNVYSFSYNFRVGVLTTLDRSSFDLLVEEEKTFIVYVNQCRDNNYFRIRSVAERNVLVLFCCPEGCPSVLQYVSHDEMPAVLFFFRGKFLDKFSIHKERICVCTITERFVKLSENLEKFLLNICIYQRRKSMIEKIIKELYWLEVRGGEKV